MFDKDKYIRYGVMVSGGWMSVLFFIGILYTGLRDVEPVVYSQYIWSFVSLGLVFTVGVFSSMLWLDYIKWETTKHRP